MRSCRRGGTPSTSHSRATPGGGVAGELRRQRQHVQRPVLERRRSSTSPAARTSAGPTANHELPIATSSRSGLRSRTTSGNRPSTSPAATTNGAHAGWTRNSVGTRTSCSGATNPAPTSNSTRETSAIATMSAMTTAAPAAPARRTRAAARRRRRRARSRTPASTSASRRSAGCCAALVAGDHETLRGAAQPRPGSVPKPRDGRLRVAHAHRANRNAADQPIARDVQIKWTDNSDNRRT